MTEKNNTEKRSNQDSISRRDLLKWSTRGLGLIGLGTITSLAMRQGEVKAEEYVWQIDPDKCVQCGRCATECVRTPSAVKCTHNFKMCGYCDLCFAWFSPVEGEPGTGAEDRMCPVDALKREHVEDVYYEYKVDRDLCLGCGKCVMGCRTSGNGSLYLQIDRNLCMDCNDCAIGRSCPADAVVRIPAGQAYIHKGKSG